MCALPFGGQGDAVFFKIAPPFRDLHLKYPIETLQELLAEGIYTGHPTMPVFTLEPDQINDVLSI